ncbi:MAG: hypothetical protein P1V18_03500 [Candidatus Gracilibacteria bacterium]|nr:hypothetical protein [Candidatus Gracilibacteria bacterium]
MRFLYFLFYFCLGLTLIRYREWFQRVSGNFAWAEKYLGIGGTYHAYLLAGLAMCFLSIMYLTGTLDGFLMATFGRFIPNQGS